jgi:predicted enzyme related to lactoylglutathione lyase
MSTHGQIGYVEIPVSDIGRSADFYEGLFGWTFVRDPEGSPDYWVFGTTDDPSMGALERSDSPPAHEGGPLIYITVDDLDVVVERVSGLGGTVERARTAIGGGMGWYALVRDPDHNRFGIWSRA